MISVFGAIVRSNGLDSSLGCFLSHALVLLELLGDFAFLLHEIYLAPLRFVVNEGDEVARTTE